MCLCCPLNINLGDLISIVVSRKILAKRIKKDQVDTIDRSICSSRFSHIYFHKFLRIIGIVFILYFSPPLPDLSLLKLLSISEINAIFLVHFY